MDARVRQHADLVVDYSAEVRAGDNVVVAAPFAAQDLVVALYERLADRGANPTFATSPLEGGGRTNPRSSRAFLRNRDEFETPSHHAALYEETDAFVIVRAFENVAESNDVARSALVGATQAFRPIQHERLSKRWCLTQYPTAGNAQLAGMSTEAYENFVWDAVLRDWDAQRDHQARMVERLDAADEVRLVSGDRTDLRLSVAGNVTLNDHGKHNLPGGEVFTAPVPDSVEGEVWFDKPLFHEGHAVEDVHLRFEDGRVVDHAAGRNEAVLTGILEADDGARRLGELGVGMNRDIDRFTYNTLFDEKMGDTVHLALGNAYAETVGEGNERNDSAMHVDLLVDMSEDSRLELDGEVVQRNGTFDFEDGFEG